VFPLGQSARTIANPQVPGETLGDIEFAAYKGISRALAAAGRPSYTTFLDTIDEGSLGQLMMRDMIATIIMGELYGLRTELIDGKLTDFGYFNQPGVVAYKTVMNAELKDLDALHKEQASLQARFG
jgi:glucose-6-phosphate isomerase